MSSYIIKSELKSPKVNYDCLGSFLIDRLKTWNENTILLDCDVDRRWTGEQVYESCLNFAYHLITSGLLKKGEIVCFITPNSDIHAIGILGVIAAGGVNCSLPPLSTNREINEIVSSIEPSFLVCNSNNYGIAATLTAEMPYIKKLFVIDEQSRTQLNLSCDTIESIIQCKRSFLALPIISSLDDTVSLTMSSGSTGKPKTIIKTNRGYLASVNVFQHEELFPLSPSDIVMGNCFCHAGGLGSLFFGINSGSTLALARNDDWNEDFLININKYRITNAFLVPSQLNFLFKNDEITDKYDISSLKDIMIGGSAVSETFNIEALKKFNSKNIRQAYGMSEVGLITTIYLSQFKSLKNYKTIGKPVVGVEIKVIDSDGNSLPNNSIGEICIRGDQVIPGYLNNDYETQKSFTSDRFFRSGDSGYFDKEGFFYIVGRYKEMIKVEGLTVVPAEIESILLTHDAVEEAAVIGIEDEQRGEVPKAFVMLKKDCEVDEQSLINFVDSRVNPIKKLRGGIKFLEQFPRSPLGKIRKDQLKYIN